MSRTMTVRNTLTLAVFAVLLLASCGKSTPVTEAPLPPTEQEGLRCTLLGTWKLEAIDNEPVEMVEQSWVFRADGSGAYQQRGGEGPGASMVVAGDNPFQWRLEGRNIFLEGEKGGKTQVYRADKIENEGMMWFNYRLSDNYAVTRAAMPDRGCE